jgi:hypothetical protein
MTPPEQLEPHRGRQNVAQCPRWRQGTCAPRPCVPMLISSSMSVLASTVRLSCLATQPVSGGIHHYVKSTKTITYGIEYSCVWIRCDLLRLRVAGSRLLWKSGQARRLRLNSVLDLPQRSPI